MRAASRHTLAHDGRIFWRIRAQYGTAVDRGDLVNAVSLPPEVAAFPVRDGRASDHAFVVQTWVHTDKHTSSAAEHGVGYMAQQKARIRAALRGPTTRLVVAHSPADEDAIVGWALVARRWATEALVHYVYVRPEARRLGVARALVAPLLHGATSIVHAHMPRRGVPE